MLEGVAILNRVVRKGLSGRCLSRFPQTHAGGRRSPMNIWVRSIQGRENNTLREEAAPFMEELQGLLQSEQEENYWEKTSKKNNAESPVWVTANH